MLPAYARARTHDVREPVNDEMRSLTKRKYSRFVYIPARMAISRDRKQLTQQIGKIRQPWEGARRVEECRAHPIDIQQDRR